MVKWRRFCTFLSFLRWYLPFHLKKNTLGNPWIWNLSAGTEESILNHWVSVDNLKVRWVSNFLIQVWRMSFVPNFQNWINRRGFYSKNIICSFRLSHKKQIKKKSLFFSLLVQIVRVFPDTLGEMRKEPEES